MNKNDKETVINHFHNNYFGINREVCKAIGGTSALYLSYLINIYKYAEHSNHLKEGCLFFCKREKIKADLGYSSAMQRGIENNLRSMDIMSTIRKDLPAKNFYNINFYKIRCLIENKPFEIPEKELEEIKKEPAKRKKATEFNKAATVIEYINEKLGTNYQTYGPKTVGPVLQWLNNPTSLLDGSTITFTVEDLLEIFNEKYKQWFSNSDFRKNLIPYVFFRQSKKTEIAPLIRYYDELQLNKVNVSNNKPTVYADAFFDTKWKFIKEIPAQDLLLYTVPDRQSYYQKKDGRLKIINGICEERFVVKNKNNICITNYVIPTQHNEIYNKEQLRERITQGFYPLREMFSKDAASKNNMPAKYFHLFLIKHGRWNPLKGRTHMNIKVIEKSTKTEYSLDIPVGTSKKEVQLLCPVCSHTRKKKNDKCLSYNTSVGVSFCFHCGASFYSKKIVIVETKIEPLAEDVNRKSSDRYLTSFCQRRKLTLDTLKSVGVFETKHYFRSKENSGEKRCVCFPFIRGTETYYRKYRTIDKMFASEGKGHIFFNHDVVVNTALFNKDEKENYIIITEGEVDCLSYIQVGYKNAVSVPTGAISTSFLENYSKLFEKIDRIYISFDNDEAGYSLSQYFIKHFNAGNIHTINLQECKDANEFLVKYGEEALSNAVKNAKGLPCEGTVTLEDVRNDLDAIREFGYDRGEPTYFSNIDMGNEQSLGLPVFSFKKKTIHLLSGHPNMGKSNYLYNMLLLRSLHSDEKWGIFTPETGAATTFYEMLVHIYCGKNIVKPKKDRTNIRAVIASKEEYEEACEWVGKHFFFIYPPDDKEHAHTVDSIMNEVQMNVKAHDIDGFVIDPCNQMDVGNMDGARDLFIQSLLRRTRYFINKYNLYAFFVEHPARSPMFSEDTLPEPGPHTIAGGPAWNRSVDVMFILHRPNFLSDVNDPITTVNFRKIRNRKAIGYGGKVDFSYNVDKQRYTYSLSEGDEAWIDPIEEYFLAKNNKL